MTLRAYTRDKLVILGANASAHEAARAMEGNHIGTILVQEGSAALGVVTDRDLTVRVMAAGRDPAATKLAEVMSRNVATLPPSASRMDAVRTMQKHNVRRVPIVDGERIVGVVTLDDLLLDEAAPLDDLAAIIRAQLGRGGPATRSRRRAEARAEGTYWRLLNEMRAAANLDTTADAEAALDIALAALMRRLTPAEAEDLAAQLPLLLRKRMPIPAGPDKRVTRESIERELVERLDVSLPHAKAILNAFGATLERNVSEGEMEDVRGQLSEDMRTIFPGGAQGS